jgi:lipopolysaccharide transport system ATP-binding protein
MAHEKDGSITDNFDITQPIGITMLYEVLKDNETFTHGMNLFNQTGINILNSHDIISELRTKPRRRGLYSSTMWIPGNFLAEGTTVVGVAILQQDPFLIHFHELDVIAFNVFDPMNGESARGNYSSTFPGAVRPIFHWNTSEVN